MNRKVSTSTPGEYVPKKIRVKRKKKTEPKNNLKRWQKENDLRRE